MATRGTSTIKSMPIQEWLEADQDAWARAVAVGDVLDDGGPASRWPIATKNKCEAEYGRWLGFLDHFNLLDRIQSPWDRATPETVKAYADHLTNSVAPTTRFMRIMDLLSFMLVTAPERDWIWLRDIKNRLWARTTPVKDKEPRIWASTELYDLGIELMDQAERSSRLGPRLEAQHYRDGLVIALLAARPVRIKNLAQIVVGKHLMATKDGYWLRFDAEETKNRRPIDVPVPEDLTQRIQGYSREHRPKLLNGLDSNHLWISLRGTEINRASLSFVVKTHTKKAFGVPINPHLFRDCAATSIAIDDPDHVRMAATMLGHTTLETTQRHYDQSRMLAAGRNFPSEPGRIRRELRKSGEGHGPYKTGVPRSVTDRRP